METESFTDILLSPVRERCAELALVLEAQGLHPQIRWNGEQWVLSTPTSAVALARLEIAAYTAESRISQRHEPLSLPVSNPWPAIGLYAAVLMAVAVLASDLRFGIDWQAAGRIDGERILVGEWWRTVTALTLHADAAHLLGNLFFGSFFGYSVARYLGSGFGWLSIVLCGALGNYANVLMSGAEHRAIGASTAVFAALGILSAYCWRRGFRAGASRRERFAPVVAGLGLLAFTGTGGENTDIGAHLLGFVAGFGGGLLIARTGYPGSPRAQRACAAIAVAIVAIAWLVAIW